MKISYLIAFGLISVNSCSCRPVYQHRTESLPHMKADAKTEEKWRQWLAEKGCDDQAKGAGTTERMEWSDRGFQHSEEVTPLLIRWARSGERPVRGRAIIALGALATQRLIRNDPVDNGEKHLEVLVIALGDEDPAIRTRAAQALAYCRGLDAVLPLIKAMDDGSEEVRCYATGSVGHYRSRRALSPLLRALKDSSPRVRNEAAGAVCQFKDDKRVTEALVEALFDRASGVAAGEVTSALHQLGAKVEEIREPTDVDGKMGTVIVGYRVKLLGDKDWRECRWPRNRNP